MGGGKSKAASGEAPSGEAGGSSGGTGATAVKRSSGSSKASGAYLIYTTDSGGMLYLQWSDTSVSGALAFFAPRKAVPAHKKTQNAGRVELMRGIASAKVKMLEGAVHFVKEATAWDSELKLLDDQYFDMWYCQGTAVKNIKPGEGVSVSKIGALAVMPHGNVSFKGVQKIDVSNFVNTATREGAAWKH
jgi:hypothetical protein